MRLRRVVALLAVLERLNVGIGLDEVVAVANPSRAHRRADRARQLLQLRIAVSDDDLVDDRVQENGHEAAIVDAPETAVAHADLLLGGVSQEVVEVSATHGHRRKAA